VIGWLRSSMGPIRQRWQSTDATFLLVVALLALCVRLIVAQVWVTEPVWDGHYYHYGAQRLAENLGYSEDVMIGGARVWKPWAHYPVGYSGYLSLYYRIFGTQAWVASLANAVVGAGLVVVSHRLAHRDFGLARARIAAAVVAVHPGLVLYSALVMSELLAALLVLVGLWLVQRAPTQRLAPAISGFVLGFAVLVRPSTLYAVPLLWLVLKGSWSTRLLRTLVACFMCLSVVLPWTIRNCYRMDGCALVSTNVGWNLAIGALTQDGRFRTLRASDGCRMVTGQVQQDRCWKEFGLRVIRRDLPNWVSLAPKKLSQTFDHESFAVEYLRESNPQAWPEPRRQKVRQWLTTIHRGFLVVACLAFVARVRRSSELRCAWAWVQLGCLTGIGLLAFWTMDQEPAPFYLFVLLLCAFGGLPLPGTPPRTPVVMFSVAFLGLTALTHVVFFGDDRYHMVTTPLLCLLAVAALRPRQSHSPANVGASLGGIRSPS
jgi:4-amino-4-deoxy-L-arabinose transferase-like glycosyltransferase